MAAKFIFSLLIIGHFGKSISVQSTESDTKDTVDALISNVQSAVSKLDRLGTKIQEIDIRMQASRGPRDVPSDSCGVPLKQNQRQVLGNWTLPFKFFMEGRYNDFAYILVLEPKLQFMEAVMACSSRASVLTDVEDAAELTFIRSLVDKSNHGGHVWLGGLYLRSFFRWIRTNKEVTTFAPGEPNKKRDGIDESCVFLHTNGEGNRVVADKYCLEDPSEHHPSELPFICKQPIY